MITVDKIKGWLKANKFVYKKNVQDEKIERYCFIRKFPEFEITFYVARIKILPEFTFSLFKGGKHCYISLSFPTTEDRLMKTLKYMCAWYKEN